MHLELGAEKGVDSRRMLSQSCFFCFFLFARLMRQMVTAQQREAIDSSSDCCCSEAVTLQARREDECIVCALVTRAPACRGCAARTLLLDLRCLCWSDRPLLRRGEEEEADAARTRGNMAGGSRKRAEEHRCTDGRLLRQR